MSERVVDRHGDTWTRTGGSWRRDESPHLTLDERRLLTWYGPLSQSHPPMCMCVGCQRLREYR